MSDEFREDCERNISITCRSSIRYESILARAYPGRIGRVMAIVEDHIYEDQDGSETIDWPAVWREMDSELK